MARDFPQDRNVSVLPWPAKSPDPNPIEHVWDLLNRRVRARTIQPRNVWELAGALVEEWGNISQQELANLVQSMRRCTAVLTTVIGSRELEGVAAKGGIGFGMPREIYLKYTCWSL
jgi:hypothetical protein